MKKINFGLTIYYILYISFFFKLYINCYDCNNDCKRVGNDCVSANNNNENANTYCKTYCRPNLLDQDSEKCYFCKTNSNQDINYYYFEVLFINRVKKLFSKYIIFYLVGGVI